VPPGELRQAASQAGLQLGLVGAERDLRSWDARAKPVDLGDKDEDRPPRRAQVVALGIGEPLAPDGERLELLGVQRLGHSGIVPLTGLFGHGRSWI
jgi:hypothetical protein